MSFVSTESNEESKNFTSSHTEKSNYVAFDKSRDYDESVIVESIQSHHKDKFQENNGNSDTQNEELDTIVENQSNDYERKPPEESKSIVISEQLTTNNEKIKIKSRYNDSAKRKIIQKLNKNKQTEVYDSKNNNKQINITARENNDNVKYKNGLIKITENESKDTPEFTLQLSNSQESQSSVESKQLRFPCGNADLLNNYSEFLTEYEQKEVLEYPIIYS